MITLNEIAQEDFKTIWKIGYSEERPKWVETDAPFLHDYQALTWEEFQQDELPFFNSPQVKGIYLGNRVIGAVTYYWENRQTRWLEIGISIFAQDDWSQGYGSQALKKWTTEIFTNHLEIERVGFSTWSGNEGMIAVGQKAGYCMEGRLRKVYYYQSVYYDAIKMGVLRSEWINKSGSIGC